MNALGLSRSFEAAHVCVTFFSRLSKVVLNFGLLFVVEKKRVIGLLLRTTNTRLWGKWGGEREARDLTMLIHDVLLRVECCLCRSLVCVSFPSNLWICIVYLLGLVITSPRFPRLLQSRQVEA